MNKLIATIASIAALAVAVAAQVPPADESLKTPRLLVKPDQKMLVVEAKGDRNTAASSAFTKLFSSYFRLPGVRMAAPRVRWTSPGLGRDPASEWTGYYALPLPDAIAGLPAGMEGVKIEVWTYGEVAEVLHVGPYDKEGPVIQALHKFIADKGYAIAGLHEEEYLVGPGMGNAAPEAYQTIIRYQVKKK